MKKTINITLNGLVFSLEEDGYEKLKNYLDSIKDYYGSPEEEKEIMSDIETSIAEKFGEKLKSAKQAITLADVEEIIKIMGTVEEITASEEAETGEEAKEAKDEGVNFKKRLYRNTDDVIIAGVASGIAAYFGLDPVFIRVLFVLLTFASGFGVLAYLVLWLAMPKAATNAQKLEMQGKPVNLAELQQVVKEKSKMIGEEGREAINRLRSGGTLYKILNFPVRIIETIFVFLKKVIRLILPAASVLFGLAALIGSVFAILGLSIVSALMVFNINSPYIVSDYPLNELASAPLYYVSIISLYAACVLPMIFLTALGITMIRRKNSFSLLGSSILIGVWMLAVIIGVVAAADLFPMVKTRIEEINRQATVTRNYDYKDFNKLYIGGGQNIKVVRGDEYSVKLTGKESGMDRLAFNIQDGQLQITQKQKEKKGICIFCFSEEITGEITVPKLDSFVGIGYSRTQIKGFSDDLYVSLGEMARADIELKAQNLTSALSGADSRLKLSGQAKTVDITMNGSAGLSSKELAAEKIILTMGIFSSADLAGEVKELAAALKNNSELIADELTADSVIVKAEDNALAKVLAKNKLDAAGFNDATIIYKGEPKDLIKSASDNSVIRKRQVNSRDDNNDNKIYIKTDAKQYSPAMSSIRGIGLLPEFSGGEDRAITFRWKTNQGALVEDFDNLEYTKEIIIKEADKKIYWTFLPGQADINEAEPIYVYLEAEADDTGRVLNSTQIEFDSDGQGMVRQKEAE